MTARTFVLDQNFPELVIRVPMPEVRLLTLREIGPWLTQKVEDWAVLTALHQRGDIDGFISCDERMLNIPKVLAVMQQTHLTMLICAEVGHDPIAATGLVLLHLPTVARSWVESPQLYVVRQTTRAEDIEQRVARVARGMHTSKADLQKLRLTADELAKPLKDWYLLQPLPTERRV